MTSVCDSGTYSGSRPLDRSHGAKSGGRRVEVGTASTRFREAAGAGRIETREFLEGWDFLACVDDLLHPLLVVLEGKLLGSTFGEVGQMGEFLGGEMRPCSSDIISSTMS